MNNCSICWFFTHIFLGILIFKGLTARRLYKSFDGKGLINKYGLSEHTHCDIAATNAKSKKARSRMEASYAGEAWVREQRKMVQVLGAFGLLNFTMLRSVLVWRSF
jgi:hypothetical protein